MPPWAMATGLFLLPSLPQPKLSSYKFAELVVLQINNISPSRADTGVCLHCIAWLAFHFDLNNFLLTFNLLVLYRDSSRVSARELILRLEKDCKDWMFIFPLPSINPLQQAANRIAI